MARGKALGLGQVVATKGLLVAAGRNSKSVAKLREQANEYRMLADQCDATADNLIVEFERIVKEQTAAALAPAAPVAVVPAPETMALVMSPVAPVSDPVAVA
jgi:hypothetical protein